MEVRVAETQLSTSVEARDVANDDVRRLEKASVQRSEVTELRRPSAVRLEVLDARFLRQGAESRRRETVDVRERAVASLLPVIPRPANSRQRRRYSTRSANKARTSFTFLGLIVPHTVIYNYFLACGITRRWASGNLEASNLTIRLLILLRRS